MSDFFTSIPFGLVLSVAAFAIGRWLNLKLKSAVVNPLLIATILIIAFLTIFHIPYEDFNKGGQFLTAFLSLITVTLAYSIYSQKKILKQYFLPLVCGCLAGEAASIGVILVLSKVFNIEQIMTASLIPKSSTIAIAVDLSAKLNGVQGITIAAVIVTGMFGAAFYPILAKWIRLKDPVAFGVAMGTSSHAVGTSRAMEIGEVQGAMSSVSLGIAGLLTVGLVTIGQLIF